MAQRYEWGWVSYFSNGEVYEEAQGYASKAAVLQDIHILRQQEKEDREIGLVDEGISVKFKVRRRPLVQLPEWEEALG